MNVLVKGSYVRCGPRKHVALLVEPYTQREDNASVGHRVAGWEKGEWPRQRRGDLIDHPLCLPIASVRPSGLIFNDCDKSG